MVKRGMKPQQAAKIRAEKGITETRLQKLRVKKGLSQMELAVKANMPKRRIQHYEHEAENIDRAKLETLCDLCIALDCKLEDILESKELIEKLRMAK